MSKKIILCIDDEKSILNSLKAQLKRQFGKLYSYEFAESAEEGFELIEDYQPFDRNMMLIVSDWLMPGMKGDEFLIKVREKHPNITKVMLTGQADDEAIKRAYDKANLFSCLSKPWSEDKLAKLIKSGLEIES